MEGAVLIAGSLKAVLQRASVPGDGTITDFSDAHTPPPLIFDFGEALRIMRSVPVSDQ